jgi:hypothetical protein
MTIIHLLIAYNLCFIMSVLLAGYDYFRSCTLEAE